MLVFIYTAFLNLGSRVGTRWRVNYITLNYPYNICHTKKPGFPYLGTTYITKKNDHF